MKKKLLRYVYLIGLLAAALVLLNVVGLLSSVFFKLVVGIAFVIMFRMVLVDFKILRFRKKSKAR